MNATVYAAVAKLNADGKLVGEPKIMDTADKVRPGSGTKVFNLLRSDNEEKYYYSASILQRHQPLR